MNTFIRYATLHLRDGRGAASLCYRNCAGIIDVLKCEQKPYPDKSTKVWRHKNEISEIMGFVRIFWRNNVQEAYLPKMSISEQIVPEIVAQLCLENSIRTLLNFFGVDPIKN